MRKLENWCLAYGHTDRVGYIENKLIPKIMYKILAMRGTWRQKTWYVLDITLKLAV